MANLKESGESYEFVVIDTDPITAGFWTNEIMPRAKNVGLIFFSIRDEDTTAVGTVTLQYKCEGDTEWQDYYHTDGADFVIGERYVIEDFGAVDWRAGIKSGNYTSGTFRLGIDW